MQHHRWPSKEQLFNNVLYRIKSSTEIEQPERTFTTDKEFVKYYIAGVVGEEYNVPTLAVLRSPEEVNTYDFPETCVIKATHGCGDVVILQPGMEPDRSALIDQLSENYYYAYRERNYRSLKGKLIVEPRLFEGQDVHDYKVFCWNGRARCILYVNDRHTAFFRLLLDIDWQPIPVEWSPHDVEKPLPEKPAVLDEMIEIAEKLSRPFDFVRVDFYIDDDRLLVGEITHCAAGANEQFRNLDEERKLSEIIFGTSST